jgi:hypothetical protein
LLQTHIEDNKAQIRVQAMTNKSEQEGGREDGLEAGRE